MAGNFNAGGRIVRRLNKRSALPGYLVRQALDPPPSGRFVRQILDPPPSGRFVRQILDPLPSGRFVRQALDPHSRPVIRQAFEALQ